MSIFKLIIFNFMVSCVWVMTSTVLWMVMCWFWRPSASNNNLFAITMNDQLIFSDSIWTVCLTRFLNMIWWNMVRFAINLTLHMCSWKEQNLTTLTCQVVSFLSTTRRQSSRSWSPISSQLSQWWSKPALHFLTNAWIYSWLLLGEKKVWYLACHGIKHKPCVHFLALYTLEQLWISWMLLTWSLLWDDTFLFKWSVMCTLYSCILVACFAARTLVTFKFSLFQLWKLLGASLRD